MSGIDHTAELLERINARFHATYSVARHAEGKECPVVVVLTDTMVVFRGDERTALPFTPPLFHVIKSVAHAPVAIFVALYDREEGALDSELLAVLGRLDSELAAAEATLEQLAEDRTANQNLRTVLQGSLAFLATILRARRIPRGSLAEFSATMGPVLLRCTGDATRVQLDALNAGVQCVIDGFDERDRQTFQVVVMGDHQARARSLAMQYFEKLLQERPGAEKRITYAEGVTEVDDARALVGIRRLDQFIAGAFFGDSGRLQRDVLGDAAEESLKTLQLPSIDRAPPEEG